MLNPAIYSAHLKLHPLMVLSTLVVAEHNMGVWGLLLAVPMTVFALDYLIRYPQSTVTEVGAKELEKVRVPSGCVCVWRQPFSPKKMGIPRMRQEACIVPSPCWLLVWCFLAPWVGWA